MRAQQLQSLFAARQMIAVNNVKKQPIELQDNRNYTLRAPRTSPLRIAGSVRLSLSYSDAIDSASCVAACTEGRSLNVNNVINSRWSRTLAAYGTDAGDWP